MTDPKHKTHSATQADADNLRAIFIAEIPKAMRPELWKMIERHGSIICTHPSYDPIVVSRGEDGKMMALELKRKAFDLTAPLTVEYRYDR